MPDPVQHECKDPENHRIHICELRKAGQRAEVNALMKDPGHNCLNCNAVANNAKHLCNPSAFSRV